MSVGHSICLSIDPSTCRLDSMDESNVQWTFVWRSVADKNMRQNISIEVDIEVENLNIEVDIFHGICLTGC